MRKLFMGEARCRTNPISYFLLAEESAAGELYGVQAELDGETAAVPGITMSQRQVQRLMAGLIHGRVTPVALRDVVDDWLLA